jgi:peroxiredoxin
MKKLIVSLKIVLFSFFLSGSLLAGELPNFQAIEISGKKFELYSHSKAKAIVFIAHSTSCPIVRQTYPRFKEVSNYYGKKNIEFWYLNSNLQDNLNSIKTEIEDFGVNISVLLDPQQNVVKLLGLKVTTELVVVDPTNWSIIYRGAIDDQINYGVRKKKATKNYLTDALEDFLSGKEVRTKSSRPYGCYISIK